MKNLIPMTEMMVANPGEIDCEPHGCITERTDKHTDTTGVSIKMGLALFYVHFCLSVRAASLLYDTSVSGSNHAFRK